MPNFADDSAVEGTVCFRHLCVNLDDSQQTVTAGTRDGRFIFLLEQVPCADDKDCCTINMDIVDTYFDKRCGFDGVDDFFGAGTLCGLYVLDEKTMVIVTYQEDAEVLTQWIVCVDNGFTGATRRRCDLFRNYGAAFAAGARPELVIGEDVVLVATRDELFMLPADPMSPLPHKDYSQMMRQAAAGLASQPDREWTDAKLCCPFIITSSEIGFFVMCEVVQYDAVVVLDLTTGESCLKKASSRTPMTGERWASSTQLAVKQISDREVAVTGLIEDVVELVAVLDTRSLQYTEIKGFGGVNPGSYLVPSAYSLVFIDQLEHFGWEQCLHPSFYKNTTIKLQQFKTIRHPLRTSSLLRLSATVLKNVSNISSEGRAMLAERVK